MISFLHRDYAPFWFGCFHANRILANKGAFVPHNLRNPRENYTGLGASSSVFAAPFIDRDTEQHEKSTNCSEVAGALCFTVRQVLLEPLVRQFTGRSQPFVRLGQF